MARAAAVSVENNFIKGLITEVTGVNSPENSAASALDVIFDRKGRATTRKGFTIEPSTEAIQQTGAISEFVWETFSDTKNKIFVVVQIGLRIYFFEADGQSNIIDGLHPTFFSLNSFKSPRFTNKQISETPCSFSSGGGFLFIAHPMCKTQRIIYEGGDFTRDRISIQIRDFEGVDDELADGNRPQTLSAAHKYNLYNQGWYAEVKGDKNSLGDTGNALVLWKKGRSDHPSNEDVWWYYTTIRPEDDDGVESTDIDKFNIKLARFKKALYGNTLAPRGHYVIDALETDRKQVSGVKGNYEETSSRGWQPSVVAFYAGRAFYGGIKHRKYMSKIYFSQIIKDDKHFGRCYQQNDPTSREQFDILSDDGGVIDIQEIAEILDFRVIEESLYVFASNGVWAISGTDNGPFKATDYTVSKVSSFPALSRSSVVDVGGRPFWWNYEGIFTLSRNELGSGSVTNLSATTIKTFFEDIPQESKVVAKGAFNDQDGLVYWLYSTDSANPSIYDRILVMDVITQAFYPLSVPTSLTRTIVGLVPLRISIANETEEDVTDNALADVTDDALEQVTVFIDSGISTSIKAFKFLTLVSTTGFTFSTMDSDTYLDWGSEDYEPYFITGYKIRGELLKKFQTNYLTVITAEEDNNSCYMQGVWDYTNDEDSGRFTNPQQCIRNKTFRDYQRSKLKVRGHGYSLQFKFFGDPGSPFTIVGWAGFETANTVP